MARRMPQSSASFFQTTKKGIAHHLKALIVLVILFFGLAIAGIIIFLPDITEIVTNAGTLLVLTMVTLLALFCYLVIETVKTMVRNQ